MEEETGRGRLRRVGVCRDGPDLKGGLFDRFQKSHSATLRVPIKAFRRRRCSTIPREQPSGEAQRERHHHARNDEGPECPSDYPPLV